MIGTGTWGARCLCGLAVLLALLAGCGPAPHDAWTDGVRQNFLDSCEASSGGQTDYCACVLADLEDAYSLAEFEAIEQQLDEGGEVPDALELIIDACIERHIT